MKSYKKIAIFGTVSKKNDEMFLKILVDNLAKYTTEIFIKKELLENNSSFDFSKCKTFSKPKELNSSFDLLLTFGGDGTILNAIPFLQKNAIPILGINTGRLGFLAQVPKNEIENAIKLLFENQFTIEKRTLLKINSKQEDDFPFALNEITVSRKNSTSMMEIETFLNEEYLNTFWADGLLVSTPTGSTGYSLSCQGPIVFPNCKNLIINPIAPHNLNARPLIISNDEKIKLKIKTREDEFFLSLDTRMQSLKTETEITIEKADFQIQLINLQNQNFIKTLRKKLFWGEDYRNKKV